MKAADAFSAYKPIDNYTTDELAGLIRRIAHSVSPGLKRRYDAKQARKLRAKERHEKCDAIVDEVLKVIAKKLDQAKGGDAPDPKGLLAKAGRGIKRAAASDFKVVFKHGLPYGLERVVVKVRDPAAQKERQEEEAEDISSSDTDVKNRFDIRPLWPNKVSGGAVGKKGLFIHLNILGVMDRKKVLARNMMDGYKVASYKEMWKAAADLLNVIVNRPTDAEWKDCWDAIGRLPAVKAEMKKYDDAVSAKLHKDHSSAKHAMNVASAASVQDILEANARLAAVADRRFGLPSSSLRPDVLVASAAKLLRRETAEDNTGPHHIQHSVLSVSFVADDPACDKNTTLAARELAAIMAVKAYEGSLTHFETALKSDGRRNMVFVGQRPLSDYDCQELHTVVRKAVGGVGAISVENLAAV